jgi:hypothetical protein
MRNRPRNWLLQMSTVAAFLAVPLAGPVFADLGVGTSHGAQMAAHWQAMAAAQMNGLSNGAAATYDFGAQRGAADAAAQPAADLPVMVAAADSGTADVAADAGPVSEECLAFAKDRNADVGAIIRAGCQPTTAQMSALMDNPLGNVAMLFTQFDYYKMENPTNGKKDEKGVYTGIFQFPKKLNDDWNLINRVIWTVPSVPLDQDKIDDFELGSGPGGAPMPPDGSMPAPVDLFDGRTTGFGDMYYVGLFAPSEGEDFLNGKFLWGAGFDVMAPTATEDVLGTGKWAAGPSALGVYMGPKWKVGALGMHYWDFAGDDDRSDVNLTNLQYFVYYSLDETTSIGASPNIIANWEQDSDDAFTVPVGLGINKTFQFGKVPVRIGAEVHYSVIQPDDVPGTEWDFRFYVIPAVPSALFSWMQ